MPASRMLSIAHLSALEATPLELIDGAARAGLDALGLRIIAPRPGDIVADVAGNRAAIRELKTELAARGLVLSDIEAIILKEETDLPTLDAALEAGAELGARHVVVNMYIEDPHRAAERFGELCRHVARHDLNAALEFIPLSLLKTLDAALAVLGGGGQPNGKLLIDAIHLSRSGGHPRDLAKVAPELFAFAHLCDAPLKQPGVEDLPIETRQQRLLPGKGELWLDEFVAALPPTLQIGIEAPCLETAGLPVAQKVVMNASAARRVLGIPEPRY